MTDTAERLDNPKATRDQMRFFELVREGVRPLHAATEVGWSPAKFRRLQKDPDFAELLHIAEEMVDEFVESAMLAAIKRGNVRAQMFWLTNRQKHKWRDVRHLEVEGSITLDAGQIEGAKAGVLEALRSGGTKALRAATDVDAEVVDAEVVDASDA